MMRETCHEVLNELGLHDDRPVQAGDRAREDRARGRLFRQPQALPERRLHSGIVQRALGIPVAMFTCIFSLARHVGWIAQCRK